MFDKSNSTHPPAGRFNAGQKLIFWSVVLGGVALSVSGIFLLFPFAFTDVNGMQTGADDPCHRSASLMVAVIIAHIYIGTLGMEGAFDAMGRAPSISTGPRSTTAPGSRRRATPERLRSERRRRPNRQSRLAGLLPATARPARER